MTDRHDKDRRMVKKIGDMLEDSASDLHAKHGEALRLARQRALRTGLPDSRRRERRLALAAAAGVAALAAGVLLVDTAEKPSSEELVTDIEDSDFEILLGDESLDMIADYEFYDWLSAQADAG